MLTWWESQVTAPWLVVRLRRRCADDELVAEVMQETYLAVWQAAGAFAGACVGGSAVGWMWTIAARRLVDAFRRRARQAQVPPAALAAQTVPAAEDLVLGATVGDEMGEVLRRLAPELRQVLQATPRRAAHVILAATAMIHAGPVARNLTGMIGLVALTYTILSARR